MSLKLHLEPKHLLFVSLVALFLVIRIFILLYSPYVYLNSPEERYRGYIAAGLIEGLDLTPLDYQYTHYEGGSVFIGLFLVPLFKLFGPTYFSMKILGLFFSLGILVLVYIIFYKTFGLKTAALGCLIFTAAVPRYLIWDLIAAGGYHENVFFTFLTLLIFYYLIFERRGSVFLICLLGFLCGLSLWVQLTFSIVILIILFIWFMREPLNFMKKYSPFFGICFLLGFSPWILYNIKMGFQGLDIIRSQAHAFISADRLIVKKAADLFFIQLPPALGFNNTVLNYVYYTISCAGVIFIFYQLARKAKGLCDRKLPDGNGPTFSKQTWLEACLFLYLFLYSLLYLFCGYKIRPYATMDSVVGYRYAYPYLPFIFMAITILMSYLINYAKRLHLERWVFVFIFIFVIFFGSGSVYSIINFKFDSRPELKQKLINHDFLYFMIGAKLSGSDLLRSAQGRIPDKYKKIFYFGVGMAIGSMHKLKYILTRVNGEGADFVCIGAACTMGNLAFYKKEILFYFPKGIAKENEVFFNLGLSLSDFFTGAQRFPAIKEALARIPKTKQDTIKNFVTTLLADSDIKYIFMLQQFALKI